MDKCNHRQENGKGENCKENTFNAKGGKKLMNSCDKNVSSKKKTDKERTCTKGIVSLRVFREKILHKFDNEEEHQRKDISYAEEARKFWA